MAKGIEIDLLANVRDFQAGTQDAETALRQVADSLDDVARDGDVAADRLERRFSDLADGVKRDSTSIGTEGSDGFRKLGNNATEVGDELKQNLGETFSSFRGDLTDLPQIAQDTLGGLAGSGALGGIPGLFVTAAGAAGLGLLIAQMEKGSEDAEAFKEKVAGLTDQLIEVGEEGPDALEAVLDKIREMATTTDDATLSLTDLEDAVGSGRYSLEDYALAIAGTTGDYDGLIAQQEAEIERIRDEAAELKVYDQTTQDARNAMQAKIDAHNETITALQDQRKATNEARQSERAWYSSGADDIVRKADLIAQVNDAYDDAAGSVDDFLRKEKGTFNVDKYIQSMQKREEALAEYQAALVTSELTPEAIDFLNTQGFETADAMLDGYRKAAPKQQAELNRIWTEAGRDNSGEYTKAIERGLPSTVDGPTPVVKEPDFRLADRALNSWVDRQRDLTINVDLRTRNGQAIYP